MQYVKNIYKQPAGAYFPYFLLLPLWIDLLSFGAPDLNKSTADNGATMLHQVKFA